MSLRKLTTTTAACVASLGVAAAPAAAHTHRAAHHRHPVAARRHRRGQTKMFTAQVVRSTASRLVVRTASGRELTFAASQIKPLRAHHLHVRPGRHGHAVFHTDDLQLSSGNVVVNLVGLQPGVTIQITETTDTQGNVTITITLPSSSPSQSADGVVTEVDTDALTLQTDDGSELRLHVSADTLANLNVQTCDTASVTYHQDAGILVADNVTDTGTSTSGDCAPSYDATGTITQVSDSSVTINADQGAMTFAVDPASGLTDGYQVGDLVDVTYGQNADGSLSASDVEFVEEETTGTVTSVTTSADGGSLTITDDNTGQPDVFAADPANGVQINGRAFNGISVNDSVDITYHQSAGALIADTVSEQ